MKAIPITVINYNNNNNQYAELAFFAEEDEDEGYEWDCMQAIIAKPLLLSSIELRYGNNSPLPKIYQTVNTMTY